MSFDIIYQKAVQSFPELANIRPAVLRIIYEAGKITNKNDLKMFEKQGNGRWLRKDRKKVIPFPHCEKMVNPYPPNSKNL